MNKPKPTVAILAYGSLIDEPGAELAPIISITIRDVFTPFNVEFARKSSSRGDAPTLIPCSNGTPVRAALLVVETSAEEVANMLWRRETRTIDTTRCYPGPRADRPNAVVVEQITNMAGFDRVLYTAIGANITLLTPHHLAELAISSVRTAPFGLDGITYLVNAKSNGIVTPLSPAYEAEILRLTQAESLECALASLRSNTG